MKKWDDRKPITHRLRRPDGSLIATVRFATAKDGTNWAYAQLRWGQRQWAFESCARDLTYGGQKARSALHYLFGIEEGPDVLVEKVPGSPIG